MISCMTNGTASVYVNSLLARSSMLPWERERHDKGGGGEVQAHARAAFRADTASAAHLMWYSRRIVTARNGGSFNRDTSLRSSPFCTMMSRLLGSNDRLYRSLNTACRDTPQQKAPHRQPSPVQSSHVPVRGKSYPQQHLQVVRHKLRQLLHDPHLPHLLHAARQCPGSASHSSQCHDHCLGPRHTPQTRHELRVNAPKEVGDEQQ